MTGFVVTNLLDTIVGCVWEAKTCEGCSVEHFNALLIEAENCPFGRK